MANTFRVVRAALVAFGGAQVIGRAIELEKTLERTRLSLNSLTGSLAAGNQAYQNAAKFSSEYGFQLDKTLKATQELLLSGKSLNEIPEIMRQLGGVSRATGADIDTLSDEFIKLRTTGAASAKTLGPLLQKNLGTALYEAVKNNGELSLHYFKQLGPQLGDALTSGMGGMNKALNDLQLNADKFVQAFLGTDNANKMQLMAKGLAFVTENMVAFKLALAAVVALLFGPAGWIVGFGLAVSALVDLDDKLSKSKYISNAWSTGVDNSIPILDEQGNAIAHNSQEFYKLNEVTQQVASDFTDFLETMGNVTVGTGNLTSALSELELQEKAMRASLGNTLVDIEKQFSTLNIMTDVLKTGFNNIGNSATQAFVGIIKGTMTARDAGRMLADAIVTELITAFVRLFIVGPIMAFIAQQLGMVVDSEHDTARAVERTNRALQKQIGLRLILMALGFAKGGPVQAGGQPAARALGGPTSGNMPYMVGERGPELFVPNNSGTIVPNDRLNFGSGMEPEMGRGNNASITFNINTLDARDFDNLLTTRQDLIINLINRGLTERGKARLV